MPEGGPRHITALDGLRGVAVVLVLLFHGSHLSGGFLGVDVFFVLSGFLITGLLLAEGTGTGGIALGAFWARRARRLLPALALMLAGVAVAAAIWSEPAALAQIRGDALGTIAYVANWRAIASGRSYFDLFVSASPLEHTWSLAIEEQFYLLWPLVILGLTAAFRRRLPNAVLILAVGAGLASTALMAVLYSPSDTARAYYGTDTRAAALFAGIAVAAGVALWGHVRDPAGRWSLEVIAGACVAYLAYACSRYSGDTARLYRGGFLAVAVAAGIVVLAAVQPRRGPIAVALSFRPLCWLGLISYGLYLWHWPVDVYLDADRLGIQGWALFTVDTAIALAISVASYRFLEMPIRRGALGRRTWAWAIPTVAIGVVALVLAATAGARPLPVAAGRIDDASPGGVLVVGDSLARSVAPGLHRHGFVVSDWGFDGCRLLRGTVRGRAFLPGNCGWRPIWRDAVGRTRPAVVLLVEGAFNLADVRPPGSQNWLVPGTPRWARYFRAGLDDAVEVLSADGATVVIPRMPCLSRSTSTPALAQLSQFDPRRVDAANAVIDQLARTDDRVVAPDLFGFLCPTGRYQTALRGVSPVRVDGVHFGDAGSDLVAGFLEPSLRGAARRTTR